MTIRTTNVQNGLISFAEKLGKVYRFDTYVYHNIEVKSLCNKLVLNCIHKLSIREERFVRADKYFVSACAMTEFKELVKSHDN